MAALIVYKTDTESEGRVSNIVGNEQENSRTHEYLEILYHSELDSIKNIRFPS